MSLPWWKPDEELLAASLAEMEERASDVRRALARTLPSAAELPSEKEEEAVQVQMAGLLEAVGTLVFLGLGDTVRDRLGNMVGSPAATMLAVAAVRRLIEASLTPVLSGLMTDVYHLFQAEDGEKEFLEERIVDAMTERDRVELALEGARLLCGRDLELDEDTLADLGSFDEVLRAELWRTLPLGDRRAARCAWVAPGYRKRLWWWSRGCDLPHTALQDMQTAARVIHLFPEARAELERMLQAEQDLDSLCGAGEDRGRRKVISLRVYVLRKFRLETPTDVAGRQSSTLVAGPCLPYSLAASTYEEKPLFQTKELTVSTDGERLIVDIESPAEPAPDSPPVLETEGLAPLEATRAQEPARFVFSLSCPHFSSPEAWLVVKLATAERRIRLPFEENG